MFRLGFNGELRIFIWDVITSLLRSVFIRGGFLCASENDNVQLPQNQRRFLFSMCVEIQNVRNLHRTIIPGKFAQKYFQNVMANNKRKNTILAVNREI